MHPRQGPLRKRAACDRCHTQKLRCPRPLLGQTCSRCQKAGLQCVFSVSKRGNTAQVTMDRPIYGTDATTGVFTEQESTMSRPAMFGENIGLNDGIGISGEGFDDQIQLDPDFQLWDSYLESLTPSSTMFNGSTFEAKPQNSSNVPQDDPAFQISGATSSNETESTANMSTSLGSGSSEEPTFDSKLLDLSDRLVSHVNTIPPVSIHTHLHPNDVGAFRKAKEDYNFSIEETFQLTQTMIDLYAGLTNIMKPTSNERHPQHEDDLEGPEATAEQPSEQGHKVLGRCANMPSRVDSATILLALSCHHRLIYIWDNVFIHFNEMLKNNVFQHPNYLQKYSCSQLKIGSFVPVSPAGSASTLMMLIWDSLRTLHQSLETFSESIRFYSTARKTSGRSSSDIGDTSEPLSEDIGIEILALHSTVGACDAAITLSAKLAENSDLLREKMVNFSTLK